MNVRTFSLLLAVGAILIMLTVVTNAASGQWAVQPPPAITILHHANAWTEGWTSQDWFRLHLT